MFALPPKGDAHWVYDDPSGVPEPPMTLPVSLPAAKPKRGKVVRFPFPAPAPVPATPKAA
jgi:hypothetical protein